MHGNNVQQSVFNDETNLHRHEKSTLQKRVTNFYARNKIYFFYLGLRVLKSAAASKEMLGN